MDPSQLDLNPRQKEVFEFLKKYKWLNTPLLDLKDETILTHFGPEILKQVHEAQNERYQIMTKSMTKDQ